MTQATPNSKIKHRLAARARRAECAAALPDFAERIARFADAIPLEPGSAVAGYWPLPDEADPKVLAAALASRGHPVLLPCIDARDERLNFRLWRDGDPMLVGHFGISEPSRDAAAFEPSAVFVPLLAFDRAGHRLGYGGGYYDRTLAALRSLGPMLAIGVAYAGQELDELLQNAPHDERLDMVITENGVRQF
jgi:5-formyltetrahydrofolate cyclo-ligase